MSQRGEEHKRKQGEKMVGEREEELQRGEQGCGNDDENEKSREKIHLNS